MNLPNLKPGLSKLAATGYTLLAGLVGAAVTGAATGVTQAATTGHIDENSLIAAATSGAVLGIGAYLTHSPLQSSDQ